MSSNPYEDFLEATREAPMVTLSKHLARYAMSRTASTMFAYPWEAMIMLRQVQHPAGDTRSATAASVLKEKTLDERRKEYEEYLLGKAPHYHHSSSSSTAEKPLDIGKDPDGYLDLQRSSIGRIKLDLRRPVSTSLHQCAQLEGLAACWQGCMAWNTRRIALDCIQDGLLPLVLAGQHDHRLAVEAVLSAVTALLLNPIDVIHARLVMQSPFAGEQAYPHGMYSVVKEMRSARELLAGSLCNVAARVVETVGTSCISRVGCALVDRLGWAGYSWLTAARLVVHAVAVNAPLLLTLPLDTVRRRAAVPDRLLLTRVPVRPDWPVAEQLADPAGLYQGYGFRIATNLALLLINLMGELEGDWLAGGGGGGPGGGGAGDDF